MNSLTTDARRNSCELRKDKKIPGGIQFVCVMGTYGRFGDGIVPCSCQWPNDLQTQGIPGEDMEP